MFYIAIDIALLTVLTVRMLFDNRGGGGGVKRVISDAYTCIRIMHIFMTMF